MKSRDVWTWEDLTRPSVCHHFVTNSHSTIEQVHRLFGKSTTSFEKKTLCSSLPLRDSGIWSHTIQGALCKIKNLLPATIQEFYSHLKDYVKYNRKNLKKTSTHSAGISQGRVAGPSLHPFYTHDMPDVERSNSRHNRRRYRRRGRQRICCHCISTSASFFWKNWKWLSEWRITLNIGKLKPLTFTLKEESSAYLPKSTAVSTRYLGIQFDSRLMWNTSEPQ